MTQLRGRTIDSTRPRGRRGLSGFTLVEILIVIAIMVAIMAITVPGYRSLSANNRRAGCAANMKALGQALAIFRDDYQCFPPDETEYLWTEDAIAEYVAAYGVEPPGDTSVGTLVSAAYHPDGRPFVTSVRGLGLFTLFYLGEYAAQPPPTSSDLRVRDYPDSSDPYLQTLRTDLERNREGLNGLPWFRGSGYITKLNTYHCPANPVDIVQTDLPQRAQLPTLRGWNNYDQYYRRNFWHPGAPTEFTDKRNLFEPYPPADTVVTWCPHHRRSEAPPAPGVEAIPRPGDQDLVLFVDGTVRRMAAQQANRMYQEPSPEAGWPEGPIM